MPQASIYLDATTFVNAKRQAAERNLSLSRHLADLVDSYQQKSEWPSAFFNTFGALADGDIEVPERPTWDADQSRRSSWEGSCTY